MQSAMQSFEETLKIVENKFDKELDDVFVKINASIKDGKFYVFEKGKLSEYILYKLKKLGYDARNEIDYDGNYYWISWCAVDVYKPNTLSNIVDDKISNNSDANSRKKAKKYKFPIFW